MIENTFLLNFTIFTQRKYERHMSIDRFDGGFWNKQNTFSLNIRLFSNKEKLWLLSSVYFESWESSISSNVYSQLKIIAKKHIMYCIFCRDGRTLSKIT